MCREQYPNLIKVNIVPQLLHICVHICIYICVYIYSKRSIDKIYLLKKNVEVWIVKKNHIREKEKRKKETLNRSTIFKDFKPDFSVFKIHRPSELYKLFYRKEKKGFPNSFMKPWFSGTKQNWAKVQGKKMIQNLTCK